MLVLRTRATVSPRDRSRRIEARRLRTPIYPLAPRVLDEKVQKAPPTGRYREIEPLGSGGMATVALALDTVLGRLVALKRVHTAGSPREVARLRREALVGASLQHRNLVAVYDVEEDEGRIVIVMEYVRGTTLRDLLASRGVPGNEESIRILEGVAHGLDALHARGIIHRDVKPANVLLGEDGAVKLADLGIASVTDRTQSTAGAMFGTFSYMAPEQLEGDRATPATDVYALAALAFELLAGEKARTELNPLALAHAMATQPPPDIRGRAPEISAPAARLLQGAMSARREQRPRTAGELVERLREALLPGEVARSRASGRVRTARPAPARAAAPAGAATPAVRSPRTAPSARASRRRGVLQPVASRQSRRSRLLAPLLIGLVALAALLLALDSGSSQRTDRASARNSGKPTAARHGHGAKAPAGATRSADATAPKAAAGPPSPSATRPSPPAASSTPTPAASHTQAPAAGPAGGPTGEAGAPAAVVEAFYGAAARHDYAAAWRLADQNMRNEVAGYDSFSAQQSAVRSITFHRAETLPGATASQAAVAVRTTSVLADRTEQCSGTVRTVRAAAGWLLDGISIDCTP